VNLLKNYAKRAIPRGLMSALRNLKNEIHIWWIHKDALRRAQSYAGQSNLKLNIGCGQDRKEGWVNIDLDKNGDLRLDMREQLPFSGASVDLIYSEHF